MARPYVSRPVTLFVAVPLAAVAGMLVLGILAFIVALVIAVLAGIGDIPVLNFDFGGRGKKANVRGDSARRAWDARGWPRLPAPRHASAVTDRLYISDGHAPRSPRMPPRASYGIRPPGRPLNIPHRSISLLF